MAECRMSDIFNSVRKHLPALGIGGSGTHCLSRTVDVGALTGWPTGDEKGGVAPRVKLAFLGTSGG